MSDRREESLNKFMAQINCLKMRKESNEMKRKVRMKEKSIVLFATQLAIHLGLRSTHKKCHHF